MTQFEEVISFFTNLKSYQRISLMCKLLYRCMPFELRFVGSSLENLCKKDYQELRHAEIEANSISEISSVDLGNLGDLNSLRKIILYLSLLYSHNWRCAHEIYKVLSRTEEVIVLMKTVINEDLMEHLLTVYTLAINHPAFSSDERRSLHSIYDLFPKNGESVHETHENVDRNNYPDGADEREDVLQYSYAVQQGHNINNVPFHDTQHNRDVNIAISHGNHIGYTTIIPTWAAAVQIPPKEYVNSRIQYTSRSSSPGTSSIPSRSSSPHSRPIYEVPMPELQVLESSSPHRRPIYEVPMPELQVLESSSPPSRPIYEVPMPELQVVESPVNNLEFMNANVALQNYSTQPVSRLSEGELLPELPEQMIQQLRISLNEPQINGISCETNSDLVHLQSSGPSSAPAILCTSAMPFFSSDVLAPCVTLQEHLRTLSVDSSSGSTSTGSNSDAASPDSPPDTPSRSNQRNLTSESIAEDKICMPPPAPPNDKTYKPRSRVSATYSANRVKTPTDAVHRKRADSLNGRSEDHATWKHAQSDNVFATAPATSLPYLPVGPHAFLPRHYFPMQTHGELYYHPGAFIPVQSPFNAMYSGGVVSCFNCGSNTHLGIECTEPTIEETIKPGQYKLDFTSNSSRDDSPSDN